MSTIKEKRKIIDDNHREYMASTYIPALKALTSECAEAGHVNLETKTRDNGTQFFVCDNCGSQVNL